MPQRNGNSRSLGGFAWLLLSIVGCESTQQERVRLYNQDGIEQISQGHYREAVDSFQEALVLKPDDPVIIFNLAQAYDRSGNAKQAEVYYQECLRRDANLADARQGYANLLMRTGRVEQANQLIDQWTKEGDQADIYVLTAWKLRQEKRYPEAQTQLQAALAKDPHNPRAQVELGMLYEKMNLPERSLALYERVLQQNPNLFEVRERIATLKAQGVGPPLPGQ